MNAPLIKTQCLKAALEMRVTGDTPMSIIDRAKQFEAYVAGEPPAAVITVTDPPRIPITETPRPRDKRGK